jgi:hypothetical protein
LVYASEAFFRRRYASGHENWFVMSWGLMPPLLVTAALLAVLS